MRKRRVAGYAVNALLRASIGGFLLHALRHPHDPRYEGKAIAAGLPQPAAQAASDSLGGISRSGASKYDGRRGTCGTFWRSCNGRLALPR